MNKILVLTPAPEVPGGVANYYVSIGLNEYDNIDYFYVGSMNSEMLSFPLFRFIRFVNFLLIVSEYDKILINPSLDFKGFCRDSIYILLAKYKKKKVFTFFRGWDNKFENRIKNSRILRKYFRFTFGKTDQFIVLGKIFEGALKELISPDIICHLETTVANDSFINLYKPLEIRLNGPLKVLFLGRIVESKGIKETIDLVNRINNSEADKLVLHILGDGPDFIDIKNQNINKNIIFHGYLNGEEKYKVISDCHLLLFPTMYKEGLPNAILESMLFGLPIVTTSVAGIPDVVIDNENGIIIDVKDISNCVERINNLINNKELMIKISQLNHSKAIMNFTSSQVRSRILNILNH